MHVPSCAFVTVLPVVSAIADNLGVADSVDIGSGRLSLYISTLSAKQRLRLATRLRSANFSVSFDGLKIAVGVLMGSDIASDNQ